jgi:uncharacterized integral membrane protein
MNAKIIGIIVLLAVLVIFAIQNAQPVAIKFLFWGFETTAVLSILASFLIGFFVGWLVMARGRSGKGTKRTTDHPEN